MTILKTRIHSLIRACIHLVSLLLIGLLMTTIPTTTAQTNDTSPPPAPATFRNPLNVSGPDPWLQYYDGYYYLAYTTGVSHLIMQKSETLAGLKTAPVVTLYRETEPSRCCNMWAPEFHLLANEDGDLRWYYYYSAGTSGTHDNQRSHVLESAGTDPMGPYTYKGRIFDPANDGWSIDGSILKLNDALYFLFSVWVGEYQGVYIAPMSNPWTISGERRLLTQSEYDWERSGLNVTEGPVALYHADKTFIVYSASFCATADYKLGILTYDGVGDPLDAASWAKSPEPVFQRSDENSVFGPGHNGFFKSPDGTEDWIVYHANDSASYGCDARRTTRVQKFTWNDDGTPNFGVPISIREAIAAPSGDTGVDPLAEFPIVAISVFKSAAYDDAYLRHLEYTLTIDFVDPSVLDAQFIVRSGLADSAAISIESLNYPGHFIRHQNNAVVLGFNEGGEAFAADATWWRRPGLSDENGITFESYNRPGFVIGRQFGVVALVAQSATMSDAMREDATFFSQ